MKVPNGKIFIKFNDGKISTISHEYDLYELFPRFSKNFSFETARYEAFGKECEITAYDDLNGVSFESPEDLEWKRITSGPPGAGFSGGIGFNAMMSSADSLTPVPV